MGTTHATVLVRTTTRPSTALGDGLRVTARAADGVVEGIELDDAAGPWVVGVQWHPEDTAATDPAQPAPLRHLRRRAERRGPQVRLTSDHRL